MTIVEKLDKLFGDPNGRQLKKWRPLVERINSLESKVQALSDDDLRSETERLRKGLADGNTLDDILPEAFALVREAGRRTLGLRHFDVQLLAGVALHKGHISEQK